MAAPTPVPSRSAYAAIPPALSPFVIRADGHHDLAATTVLGRHGDAMVALAPVSSGAAGGFGVGQTNRDSDAVFIAWAHGASQGSPPVEFSVERDGLVVASVVARHRAFADVPAQLPGVEGAYVLWLSVRGGELTVKMPPPVAVVTIDSIARWVTSEP
jgi:hypothetical protein